MTFGTSNFGDAFWEQWHEYVTNGRTFRVLRPLWNDALIRWLDTGKIEFINRPRDPERDIEAENNGQTNTRP